MIREACVEGFTQALRAQELGAERIELCENLAAGGTTPSLGTVIACKKYLKIPVIVMIRPRGGNFVYGAHETEIMARDIEAIKMAGADGIAIGLLTQNGAIDLAQLLKVIKHAGSMQITFHKAIDATRNIEREFLKLRDSGLVHRVLTSGGAETALNGAPVLNNLLHLTDGKIRIVVAGKVTSENLQEICKLIPADEFHGKKIV
jgi:copper homeostasis protein